MKQAIDNFSKQADTYKVSRPTYPQALYDFLLAQCPSRATAWDCGTGNGQVAMALADHFELVTASDLSGAQLAAAEHRPNIRYIESRAEHTPFPDHAFDLITVGQAAHWFDMAEFSREAKRVGKTGGHIGIFGYGLMRIDAATDALVWELYEEVLGEYWDPERRIVEGGYQELEFDFPELETPTDFAIADTWNVDRLLTFLHSWSATQKYKDAHGGEDPVNGVEARLRSLWREETKEVQFPVFLRLGNIE
ncbi:MAG TPA: SAM-dependent methyltransferase [Cytophagales bacterium]|nr:SAM-dependent methyltransferase [Cytophagales bacterium]